MSIAHFFGFALVSGYHRVMSWISYERLSGEVPDRDSQRSLLCSCLDSCVPCLKSQQTLAKPPKLRDIPRGAKFGIFGEA